MITKEELHKLIDECDINQWTDTFCCCRYMEIAFIIKEYLEIGIEQQNKIATL